MGSWKIKLNRISCRSWFRLKIGMLLIIFLHQVSAQDVPQINFTIKDGLPSNTIYGIIQDKRGFIWIGTDAGLSRYDGYEFKNYDLSDGLPDVEILNLFEDSVGRIWLFTLNGQVGYIEGDSIYTSSNRPAMAALNFQSRINSIIERDGVIYLSAFRDGIKSFDPSNEKTAAYHLESLITSYLCNCTDYIYWLVGTNNQPDKNDKPLPENVKLIVGTSNAQSEQDKETYQFFKEGIAYLDCENDSIAAYHAHFSNQQLKFLDTKNRRVFKSALFGKEGDRIYNFKLRPNKTIAVYSSSGVYDYSVAENEFIKRYAFENSTSEIIDHEGNTWITSLSKGVLFLPNQAISKLGLDIQNITKLAKTDQELLVLHDSQFLSKITADLQLKTIYKFPKPLYLRDIAIKNDTAFVSTWDALYVIRISNNQLISVRPHLAKISDLKGSLLAIVSRRNRLYTININNQEEVETPLNFSVNDIKILGPDSLAFATGKGIYLLNQDSITDIFHLTSPGYRINRLELFQDRLFASTTGLGLLSIAPKTKEVIEINSRDGLNSTLVNEIYAEEDILWVAASNGLNRVKFNGETPVVNQVAYTEEYNASQVNDLIVYEDKMILARADGLFSFNKERKNQKNTDLLLFFDEVSTENKRVKYGETLAHHIETVSIIFKALAFKDHAGLQYQYRLITNNKEQTSWRKSSSNIVNFSNLGPGEYRFEIKARAYNNEWSPTQSFKFTIAHALWEMLWFRLFLLGAFGLFSYLAFHRITRNKRQKRQLENERIAAEIKALKAQINPHFLFNALNSIQSFLLTNEHELAEEYLTKYSKLMRRILEQSSLLTIPIHEELETIQLYVDLEKYRTGNRFDFQVILEEQVNEDEKIPSMILQPFIENAIWHGVANQENGIIQLQVKKGVSDSILLEVSDNGRGFDRGKIKKSSMGSGLVRDRLALLNQIEGVKSELDIRTMLNEGTTISIKVAGILH